MATIQVRVDDQMKRAVDDLFSRIGLDTPSAIRAFLTQSLLHNGLPFELRADPYLPYLQEADRRARAGEPTYTEEEFRQMVEELRHELRF